jgi:hypothetical protein
MKMRDKMIVAMPYNSNIFTMENLFISQSLVIKSLTPSKFIFQSIIESK